MGATGGPSRTLVHIKALVLSQAGTESGGAKAAIPARHVLAAPRATRWGALLAFVHIHTLLSQGAGLVTYWAGAPVSSRHILTPAGLADGRALPALIHVLAFRSSGAGAIASRTRAAVGPVGVVAVPTGTRWGSLGTLINVLALCSGGVCPETSPAPTAVAAHRVLAVPVGTRMGAPPALIYVNAVGALRAQPVASVTDTRVATLARDAAPWTTHLGAPLTHSLPSLWCRRAKRLSGLRSGRLVLRQASGWGVPGQSSWCCCGWGWSGCRLAAEWHTGQVLAQEAGVKAEVRGRVVVAGPGWAVLFESIRAKRRAALTAVPPGLAHPAAAANLLGDVAEDGKGAATVPQHPKAGSLGL